MPENNVYLPYSANIRRMIAFIKIISVVIISISAGAFTFAEDYRDIPIIQQSTPSSSTPNIVAADDDEILVIIARFESSDETVTDTENTLKRRLADISEIAARNNVMFRVENSTEVITSEEHAGELLNESGAALLIWSMDDVAGLSINYEIELQLITNSFEDIDLQALSTSDDTVTHLNPEIQTYILNFIIGQTLYFEGYSIAAISVLQDAIASGEEKSDDAQVNLNIGTVYYYLGRSLKNVPDLTPDALQEAIIAYQMALNFQNPEEVPLDYANIQSSLGNAYLDLAQIENSHENLDLAMSAYDEALLYRIPEQVPLDYAATQYNRGNVYLNLSDIENERENLHLAILQYSEVLRYQDPVQVPLAYARTQSTQGDAYLRLSGIENDRENLELAISAYDKALLYQNPAHVPLQYAITQHNRGAAYQFLSEIDNTRENLILAIDAYNAALIYRTPEETRLSYARTQNDLGDAYHNLMEFENRGENLTRSIAAYQEAVLYFDEDETPVEYAFAQGGLGFAYNDLDDSAAACDAWDELLRIFEEEDPETYEILSAEFEPLCDSDVRDAPETNPIYAGEASLGLNEGFLNISELDVWMYRGQAGEILTIELEAEWDTLVRLTIDDAGEIIELASNDSTSPTSLNSRIEYVLPDDTEYFIVVVSYRNESVGNYRLTLSSEPGESSD